MLASIGMLALYDASQQNDLMLGAALVFAGMAGLWGSRKRIHGLLSLHLMATFLTLLFTFQNFTKVNKEVRTECALAELHLRMKKTEDYIAGGHDSSHLQTVNSRLSEVEDLLGHVGARVQDLGINLPTKVKDLQSLQNKLDHLKDGALRLLSSIYHKSEDLERTGQLTDEVRESLKIRADRVKQVLQQLQPDGVEVGHIMTYSEYIGHVDTLVVAATQPLPGPGSSEPLMDITSLTISEKDSEKLRSTLERVPSSNAAVREQEQVVHHHRQKWSERFSALMQQQHHNHHLSDVHDLASLPGHCSRGRAGAGGQRRAMWLLVIIQAAALYMSITVGAMVEKLD